MSSLRGDEHAASSQLKSGQLMQRLMQIDNVHYLDMQRAMETRNKTGCACEADLAR